MSWQESLRSAIRDPAELLRALGLDPSLAARGMGAHARFATLVPRDFLARMRPGDAADPLLRQVLPLVDELEEAPGFVADPVGDRASEALPGLLRKYAGRALLIAAGSCAVNCRYCFRREYPYSSVARGEDAWRQAAEAIAADPSIEEVILSGGDPLVLADAALERLVARLASIPHVERLRIHTRLPIVLPDRVGDELIRVLKGSRLAPFVVVHSNHPRELQGACVAALARLAEAGIPLLNQAVLLRGVNDNADVQVELCRRLLALRVLPYYLHHLDPVRGARHYEVPMERGREIHAELRRRLPGYGVPRYVREVAGAASKLSI